MVIQNKLEFDGRNAWQILDIYSGKQKGYILRVMGNTEVVYRVYQKTETIFEHKTWAGIKTFAESM